MTSTVPTTATPEVRHEVSHGVAHEVAFTPCAEHGPRVTCHWNVRCSCGAGGVVDATGVG